MEKLKVLIVDDERLAREEIKQHLQEHPGFELVGEAGDADEAALQINSTQPDLIFLDIQMPGPSGFDLLESLKEIPQVIFTTAFDQYAVKAFEVNALDYLVKPIRQERFTKAIEKVRLKFSATGAPVENVQPVPTLFVREGERLYFIKVKDIYLVESAGNYARLYFEDKRVHIKRSLNQLEQTLDPAYFFRISRTTIINTNGITKIDALPKGKLEVTLENGRQLTISNRRSAAFKNRNML